MIISLYNIIGGGGGAVSQTLRKGEGGRSQIIFFRPFGPQFGLKIGGGGRLPGLSPGSATVESYYRMKKP